MKPSMNRIPPVTRVSPGRGNSCTYGVIQEIPQITTPTATMITIRAPTFLGKLDDLAGPESTGGSYGLGSILLLFFGS